MEQAMETEQPGWHRYNCSYCLLTLRIILSSLCLLCLTYKLTITECLYPLLKCSQFYEFVFFFFCMSWFISSLRLKIHKLCTSEFIFEICWGISVLALWILKMFLKSLTFRIILTGLTLFLLFKKNGIKSQTKYYFSVI